jgi:hypothetical protein
MPVWGRNVRAGAGLTTKMARIDLSFSRFADTARRTARGSVPPAGVDPGTRPDGPDGRQRRAIRQRLRRTRALRRARVADVGALVADMQARGRANQKLVDDRVAQIGRADDELAGLARALRGEVPLADVAVVECATCGRIGGTPDKFCAGCGRELIARSAPARGQAHASSDATPVGDLTTIQTG